MKTTLATILIGLALCVSAGAQSKYGLPCLGDTCSVIDQKALNLVFAAKTICTSGNTTVLWNKNRKEPEWAWSVIRTSENPATKRFTRTVCEKADLVVKFIYDSSDDRITFTVTDAESGDTVFEERRYVADLGSDIARMVEHWQNMVVESGHQTEAEKKAKEIADAKEEKENFCGTSPSLSKDENAYCHSNVIWWDEWLERNHKHEVETK